MVTFKTNGGTPVMIAGNSVPAHFVFTTYHTKAMSTAAILGDFEGATITDLTGGTDTQFSVASTDNTNDKAGGTGALTCRVHGFSTSGHYQYDDITLNGTTKVTTTNTDYGYIPCHTEILTCGSGKNPAGDIKVTNAAGSATYDIIADALNQSSILLIDLPSTVVGFYELTLTYQNATTAYDGLYVTHFKDTHAANEVTNEVQKVQMRGVANLDKQTLKFSGIMQGGYRHRFFSEDIGTTAQTLEWSITWGFKYI